MSSERPGSSKPRKRSNALSAQPNANPPSKSRPAPIRTSANQIMAALNASAFPTETAITEVIATFINSSLGSSLPVKIQHEITEITKTPRFSEDHANVLFCKLLVLSHFYAKFDLGALQAFVNDNVDQLTNQQKIYLLKLIIEKILTKEEFKKYNQTDSRIDNDDEKFAYRLAFLIHLFKDENPSLAAYKNLLNKITTITPTSAEKQKIHLLRFIINNTNLPQEISKKYEYANSFMPSDAEKITFTLGLLFYLINQKNSNVLPYKNLLKNMVGNRNPNSYILIYLVDDIIRKISMLAKLTQYEGTGIGRYIEFLHTMSKLIYQSFKQNTSPDAEKCLHQLIGLISYAANQKELRHENQAITFKKYSSFATYLDERSVMPFLNIAKAIGIETTLSNCIITFKESYLHTFPVLKLALQDALEEKSPKLLGHLDFNAITANEVQEFLLKMENIDLYKRTETPEITKKKAKLMLATFCTIIEQNPHVNLNIYTSTNAHYALLELIKKIIAAKNQKQKGSLIKKSGFAELLKNLLNNFLKLTTPQPTDHDDEETGRQYYQAILTELAIWQAELKSKNSTTMAILSTERPPTSVPNDLALLNPNSGDKEIKLNL